MSAGYAVTANLQGVTDPTGHVLTSALAAMPGVDVAALQELGGLRLRERLSRRILGVKQGDTLARGGVGLVWAKAEVEHTDSGVTRMCGPVRGEMRSRHLVWANLRDRHKPSETITYASTHRPLPRASLRAARDTFDANLRDFIRAATHPVVIGLDANAAALPISDLGVSFVNIGIDGFIVSDSLTHGEPFRLPRSLSDHFAVGMWVQE